MALLGDDGDSSRSGLVEESAHWDLSLKGVFCPRHQPLTTYAVLGGRPGIWRPCRMRLTTV